MLNVSRLLLAMCCVYLASPLWAQQEAQLSQCERNTVKLYREYWQALQQKKNTMQSSANIFWDVASLRQQLQRLGLPQEKIALQVYSYIEFSNDQQRNISQLEAVSAACENNKARGFFQLRRQSQEVRLLEFEISVSNKFSRLDVLAADNPLSSVLKPLPVAMGELVVKSHE